MKSANVYISLALITATTAFAGPTTNIQNLGVAGNAVVGSQTFGQASSILDLESTTQGFLPPRVTTTQKNAISSPANGLMVFDTTQGELSIYSSSASAWIAAGGGGITYAADTGSANAYAIAPTPAAASYVAGQAYSFLAANGNTGASTLNVSSLGTKNIYSTALAAIASGAISTGQIVVVVYDGTEFQMVSSGPGVTEDGNGNISANMFIAGGQNSLSATTTLTVASPQFLTVTGSSAVTVGMPLGSTLAASDFTTFWILNQNTNVAGVVVQNAAASTICTLPYVSGTPIMAQLTWDPNSGGAWQCGMFASGATPVKLGGSGLTAPTAHNLLLGEGASAFGLIAPLASAYALVSNGASSDASFQLLGYAGGGTNATTQAAAQANMSPMTTVGDSTLGGAFWSAHACSGSRKRRTPSS